MFKTIEPAQYLDHLWDLEKDNKQHQEFYKAVENAYEELSSVPDFFTWVNIIKEGKEDLQCYNLVMSIDLNKLEQIKDELDALSEDEVLYVNDDGKAKYVLMPIEMYENIEEMMSFLNSPVFNPQVKVVNNGDFELSYDEYERIKNQIMEIVEKTLMPKPEKLN